MRKEHHSLTHQKRIEIEIERERVADRIGFFLPLQHPRFTFHLSLSLSLMDSCWQYTVFCFLFFSFTFSFSIFSLLLFITRLLKPMCDCDTCHSYLSRSWLSEFNNLSDWYSHLLRHSPTGTIHIHVLNNTITSNPLNVEHMLKTRFDNYPKGKPFSTLLGDLLGKGIFNVDGDRWNFQRKMASLELGSVTIRLHALEIINSEIENRLIPLLSSSDRVFDLQDIFRRLSFDNTCRFSFGFDPKCLESTQSVSNFAEAFDLASKLSAERAMAILPLVWKVKKLFNLGSEKKLRQAIKTIHGVADDVIKNKRRTEFSTQNDLLSRFMGSMSDDKYLRDIVISFLLAGRDTVSAALTSFFWLLTQHPEVESAIRVEANLVMGQTQQGFANFEQMRKMHYLHASIYESMRLFPPVQFDSKFCEEDDVLPDDTFVKKGTRVTYHPYAMGRMDRIWGPDCLEFRPERWLKDGVFRPVCPFKYPVFQGGIRVCLGKELAIMEMKSVALLLIRKFDIVQMGPIQPPKFLPGLTATVNGGLPVQVRLRSI